MQADLDTLSTAIRQTAEQWLANKTAPSLYEINCGQCEDFAQAIIDQFDGERDDLEINWADNLTVNGDGDTWDLRLLAKHFPQSKPTHGLGWEQVFNEVPSHCWIMVHTPTGWRHYDAECPEGVENFFELPLLRRGMERISVAKES